MRQSARSTLLLSGIISMMLMSVGRICAFTSSRAASNVASSRKIIGRPETLSYFPSSTSTSTIRWMSSTASDMKPKRKQSSKPTSNAAKSDNDKKPSGGSHQPPIMNLYTISKEELQEVILMWGYPKYRADQVYHWIRERGVVDPLSMENIPKKLRQDLHTFTTGEATTKANTGDTLRVDAETTDTMNPKASTGGALELVQEQVSPKDGTTKRLYRLRDGYLIESVLMPYDDGRWTSCISSQVSICWGFRRESIDSTRHLAKKNIFLIIFIVLCFLSQYRLDVHKDVCFVLLVRQPLLLVSALWVPVYMFISFTY